MPQISLYLDQDTLKKIESAAKKEKISISQWVRDRVESSLTNDWPNDFSDLFGSIKDDSFSAPEKKRFGSDSAREKL